MAQELAFVIINPYTIRKSRTGGIIGRLLSRSNLELIAARMYAPSREMVEEYLQTIVVDDSKPNWHVRQLIKEYIRENFSPGSEGHRHRLMFLLFRGENAVDELAENVVGHITRPNLSGEMIRDTYGDCIKAKDGTVRYFEPAVMIIPKSEEAEPALRVWAKYAKQDGGLLRDVVPYPKDFSLEETSVLIKPELFSAKSIRAGNVIDIFSKTGLFIIAVKVLRMSVAQAEEFYRPVLKSLVKKLRAKVTDRAKLALERELGFNIPGKISEEIGDKLNRLAAEDQFNQIIKYMTGRDRRKVTPEEKNAPGLVRCLSLVYQGEEAVKKIRAIVGATDPRLAEVATVRREFGHDLMVNAAHASDSQESARREMSIIDFDEDDISPIIDEYFAAGHR
jgi:nucleoside diphosphate kinase